MIKYIKAITLLCLFLPFVTHAQEPQETFTLNSPESGTKNYVARDYVTLKPGFSYKAESAKSFMAKINPCLLFPPIDNLIGGPSEFSNPTGVVGTIEGSLNITPTGASTYDMPIKIVPGTGGMIPDLAVIYNSLSGNGILGQGFSLAGLSSIDRVSLNYYNDGKATSINFNDDKFALDGNRLIAISGVYGANGTEYRTENNTFVKVISYGSVNGDPQKFIVYTKDGLIKEYGYTADSRFEAQGKTEVLSWKLNKVLDTKGNYYTIEYEEDNNNGYCIPTKINYTGNKNTELSTYASVRFEYQYRSDVQNGYIQGSLQTQKKRLVSIKNYYSNELIWDYKFNYTGGLNSLKSKLVSIELTNKDNQKFNPLLFEYDESIAPMAYVNYDNSYYAANYLTHDSKIYTGDFNGDGKTDVVTTSDYNKYKSNWKGLYYFTARTDGKGFNYTSFNDLSTVGCYDPSYALRELKIGDFNGDGKSDILVCYYNYQYYNNRYYRVLLSDGNGFTLASEYSIDDISQAIGKPVLADFNGDGLTDVSFINIYEDNKKVKVYLNSGNGYEARASQYIMDRTYDLYDLGDFNGDGCADIFFRHKDGYDIKSFKDGRMYEILSGGWPETGHKLIFGDYNADKKTDYLAVGFEDYLWSNWSVNFSTGVGFDRTYFPRKRDPRKDKIYPGDYNADGITDIVFMADKDKGGTWEGRELYLGNPNGVGFTKGDEGPLYPSIGQRFIFGDFNGDAATDFFVVDDEKGSDDDYWHGCKYFQAGRAVPELLTGITNGLGEKTTIDYKPITDSEVYAKSQTTYQYPVMQIQAPMFVVSRVSNDDGVGGERSTEYDYVGLKVHLRGKGILGFDEYKVTDVEKGLTTTTFFDYDPESYVVYSTGSITKINSSTLSESSNTNVVEKDANGVIFNYVSESTQKELDLNGVLKGDTKTTYEYDDYGNVTKLDVTHGVTNNYFKTTTVNTYTNDESKWHLGRLTRTEVTKAINTQPVTPTITNVSSFEYDSSSGLLVTEIIEPDKPKFKITKRYEHDDYGNITSSTISASNLPTKTTRSEYDSKGRFVLHSYDVENYLTTKTYNEYDGSVSSITDLNGFETKYYYDGFGQVEKIEYPNDTYSVSVKRWVNSDPDAPTGTNRKALYSVYSEKSGSPAVVKYIDKYGRVLRSVTTGFNGQKVYQDTYYNAMGLVAKVSYARYESEAPQYTTYLYDALDRPIKETLPDGKYTQTQYNGLETTMIDVLGNKTTREYDYLGKLIKSTDANGKSVDYNYNSQALCTRVRDPKGNITEVEFDHMGNRIKLIDPDLGTSTYAYNAYGQLVNETDGNGNLTSFVYDVRGRVKTRTEAEGTTTYVYETAVPKIGLLKSETGPDNISYNYSYDNLGRLVKKSEYLNNQSFETSFTYDSFGRIDKTTYPSGFYVLNSYNAQGMLVSVKDGNGKVHWKLEDVSAKGQIKQFSLGNGLTTIQGYDPKRGWLDQISTQKGSTNILEYGYSYNAVGNLISRSDYSNQSNILDESFTYDDLHRLTSFTVGANEVSMQYDEIGNITYKSDVGNYYYGALGRMPHALSSIENHPGGINLETMDIEYSSFHKVNQIKEGENTLEIIYGPNHSRKIARQYEGVTTPVERYYIGSLFEREIKDGETSDIHYIMGGSGCVAVYTTHTGKEDELKYLHRDHLGSVCATTDKDGNIIEKFSYDAWGKRRDPNTWQAWSGKVEVSEKRGFTGHEHLDLFSLVNMNGRIYDPITARFLSPDPFVQMPDHTQGLNRFSYCLNNPLNLTDPSGYSWLSNAFETFFVVAVAVVVTVGTAGTGTGLGVAILSGAAGGFAGGFTGAMMNGANIGQALKAGVIGGLIGGFSAGAAKGIGKLFEPNLTKINSLRKLKRLNSFRLGREFARASLHGTVGGISNVVQGGKFQHGFFSGSFSSIAGSGMMASGIENKGTLIVSSAIVGGTSSVIGGGKFSNGAVTGGFTMWFNHLNGGEGHPATNGGGEKPWYHGDNFSFGSYKPLKLFGKIIIPAEGQAGLYGSANGANQGYINWSWKSDDIQNPIKVIGGLATLGAALEAGTVMRIIGFTNIGCNLIDATGVGGTIPGYNNSYFQTARDATFVATDLIANPIGIFQTPATISDLNNLMYNINSK